MSEPKVVLHIGFQKTGTTSIQYWLRDHEALLGEYGVRFPRGWLRLNTHFELSLCLTRLDRMTQGRLRGDEWRDRLWREDVLGQIMCDLYTHARGTTLLSNETCLLRYDGEFEHLRDLSAMRHRDLPARPSEFLSSWRRTISQKWPAWPGFPRSRSVQLLGPESGWRTTGRGSPCGASGSPGSVRSTTTASAPSTARSSRRSAASSVYRFLLTPRGIASAAL